MCYRGASLLDPLQTLSRFRRTGIYDGARFLYPQEVSLSKKHRQK